MTIEIKSGNIFNSKAQTLVNTVNCVGVMGKGIALQFKKLYPEMFLDYVNRCKHKEVQLTKPYLYKQILAPWVLNFPTKDNWRSVSRISDILAGLKYLELHYQEWGITSLAVPPLGCGSNSNVISIKPSWVALVEVVSRVLKEKYHWPIGRTTFQKLAYFATIAGLPTELEFEKSTYGPYCQQLKSINTILINNGLIKEKELGKMISIEPGSAFIETRKKYGEDINQWNGIINKITDLLLRMNTVTAEVAATVTFTARLLAQTNKRKPNNQEVFAAVRQWKPVNKYKNITDEAIYEAIANLYLLDWIDIEVVDNLLEKSLVF